MRELTIPILPCRRLDDVVPFYEALGFEVTYRQDRPHPYLCVKRGGIDLHFTGIEAFDPENSLGSVIILVPETGDLYEAFAAGLRDAYGKVPVAGIPRMTRPRRKQGTTGGFAVIDPGGNWLRISAMKGATEGKPSGALERVMLNAARQGDSRGNDAAAIAVLDAGLARHPEAEAAERVPVLVYLAELLLRSGDHQRARTVLGDLRALHLDVAARTTVAAELSVAAELEAGLGD